MTIRPAPTTTVAIGLLLAFATLPLHQVFDDRAWVLGVVGAAVAGAAVASLVETLRPHTPVAGLFLFTTIGVTVWGLLVSLREVFWRAPASTAAWSELVDGVFDGWGALLDEQTPLTDPQRASTFVAALTWIASATAVHVAARRRSALGAVLAGGAVLAVSTAATIPQGTPSSLWGVAVGVTALLAIATVTRAPDQGWRLGRIVALVTVVGLSGLSATAAGLTAASVDRVPFDPRSARETATLRIEVPDLLAEFDARRARDEVVLTVDSATPPAGLRLRLQVYDEHDGRRWIPATGFAAFASFPDTGELPPGDVVTLSIDLESLDGPWIPVPDRLITIDVPDVRWNDETQTMIRESSPGTYQITGTLVSSAEVDGLASGRDGVSERSSALPAELPEAIRAAAADAAADATDAIGAIDAITAEVRLLGRDDSTPPGTSFGRLRDDLALGGPTGAEQLASLHALMLRAVGIPSRLVVGYQANDAEVRSDDLDIWVEAAFEGVGWVAIDPVPAVSVEPDDTESQPATPTTTEAPDATLEARALPRELGPGEDPDEADLVGDDPLSRAETVVLAAVVAMIAVGMLLAWRIVRRRLRRGTGQGADARVLGAWAELLDRLRELRAPITPTTTAGDVVFMAGAIDPELGTHARAVADIAAIALHGPTGATDDEASAAWAQLELAEKRIVAVKGRMVVPRRFLDPRVLRYRAPLPPRSRDGGRRSVVRR